LDVILWFGFEVLRGEILNCARHGVWSYSYRDNKFYRGGPSHLWELIERNPESGVTLQRLTPNPDTGIVLRKTIFSTADTLAVSRNRFAPYWGSTHFVVQMLNELHASVVPPTPAQPDHDNGYRGRRRIYGTPTNRELIAWLGTHVSHRVWNKVRKPLAIFRRSPRSPRWMVGLRTSKAPLFDGSSYVSANEFMWCNAPAGTYWADPCLVEFDGQRWLFMEEFEKAFNRGRIVAGVVDDANRLAGVRRVASAPYHLSFPQVFAHDGEMYMIPETGAAGNVQLWRAVSFPNNWVREAVILEIGCVDCTVVRHRERWWLLGSPSITRGSAAETYVWTSDHLERGWELSSVMPLCFSVRSARCAGRILSHSGDFIRPSQDCAGTYGRALAFSKLTWGDDGTVSEEPFRVIEPSERDGLRGIHSYSRVGDLEAIDALLVD
jgi:hypothetical protein